jgi:hypothetical protein
MITWKCSVCEKKVSTAVKPELIERLCKGCKVSHWRKVVSIYENGDAVKLAQAKAKLADAVEAMSMMEGTK